MPVILLSSKTGTLLSPLAAESTQCKRLTHRKRLALRLVNIIDVDGEVGVQVLHRAGDVLDELIHHGHAHVLTALSSFVSLQGDREFLQREHSL